MADRGMAYTMDSVSSHHPPQKGQFYNYARIIAQSASLAIQAKLC